MKKKQIEIMTAKPNTLGTFDMLMLLGNTMHNKNGNDYSVIIDFKNDCVRLVMDNK